MGRFDHASKRLRQALHGLRWLAVILASVIALATLVIGGIGYWIYKNPREAFQIVERHVLPADLKITWEKIEFGGARIGGLDFLIDLQIEGLHVKKESPSLDLPIHHMRVQASVLPFKRKARFHLVEARATEPLIYQASLSTEPEPEKNPLQRIQNAIQLLDLIHDRAPIDEFEIEAKRVVYRPVDGSPLEIQAKLSQEFDAPLKFSAGFLLSGTSPKKESSLIRIAAEGALDFNKIRSADEFLNGVVSVRGRGLETDQKVAMVFNRGEARIRAQGDLSYRNEKTRLVFKSVLQANFKPDRADLVLRVGVRGIPGPLVKIDDIKVEVQTPLEEGNSWSEKPSVFSVQAPVAVFFVDKPQRASMEKSCACKLPEIVMVQADGQLWFSALLEEKPSKRSVLEGRVSVESVHNKIFSIDLAADLKIEKERNQFLFSPHLNCVAKIHHFQSLKPLLDSKNVFVPAPFDILDGTLGFKANGPVTTTDKGSKFPLTLDVDLASKTQKVKIDTEAAVEINPQFNQAHLDVKARVLSLFLDLPPLDPLDGLPRIAPDSRFIKTPKVVKTSAPKFKLSFNFEVETIGGSAIRLASKYFVPYLPLNLKIQSSGAAENSGFIQSDPFAVTYLRRTVHVENLKIDLDGSDKGIYPLKGRFSVKQTQYTVFIDVEGTTRNPAVTMSSEPYLPKNEIVSVLLYDRTSDQLVSGDAEMAGGVQAAIADRAIGLFGLWAFAATPIKSFSYNPVTKIYTATLAVSDDLTAGIGTNWEAAAHLELRKRVSRRWSLTAAWTPATQEENEVTKLVLQWEKRF